MFVCMCRFSVFFMSYNKVGLLIFITKMMGVTTWRLCIFVYHFVWKCQVRQGGINFWCFDCKWIFTALVQTRIIKVDLIVTQMSFPELATLNHVTCCWCTKPSFTSFPMDNQLVWQNCEPFSLMLFFFTTWKKQMQYLKSLNI